MLEVPAALFNSNIFKVFYTAYIFQEKMHLDLSFIINL